MRDLDCSNPLLYSRIPGLLIHARNLAASFLSRAGVEIEQKREILPHIQMSVFKFYMIVVSIVKLLSFSGVLIVFFVSWLLV